MTDKEHSYNIQVKWTGELGEGTSGYDTYSRNHEISAFEKPLIPGASDPAFRGDPSRYNPEELLVASLSACHMLWYLNMCANAKIVVTAYIDEASGTMIETPEGGGQFKEVVLRPIVTIKPEANEGLAAQLHQRAHDLCFIANSVNFPVRCESRIRFEDG